MRSLIGSDIESICSKCGDVWHVVVAQVGTDTLKVQCKECGRQHRHKLKGAQPKPRARAATSERSAPRKRAEPKAPAIPEIDPNKPVRPYRATERYEAGEVIQHNVFGLGVVEQAAAPGKMQVRFADGTPRVLVQSRVRPA